ncbi:DUF2079 domain-containing protein [Nonomuraea phyllanthi]|uniref:DUF2079 domain-containing protein n=1 Tax=Nonomuraea phyllanthi TaxID=2219224 RepID=A0A5C4WEH5_9ACTN|nr:DUF2079 domain-containing protein [Nonomuraea phyllanthi]
MLPVTDEAVAARQGEPAAVPSWRPHPPGHPVRVGALALVSAAVYALLGLVKVATFRATTFDLVIIDQAVRNYAALRPPYVPVRGMFSDRGMDYLQLSDHFSPIYAVLSPFYWIHDGPETLIVAQAALFAAAIPFLWRYTRRVLGVAPAYLVSVAYALSWPVAQAVAFDVHEVMFVPLLTAIMIERYHAGRMAPALLATLGLLLVKEDMGLMVAGAGLCLVVMGDRWRGAFCVLLGLGAVLVVRGLTVSVLGGDASDYWAYGHLGADLPGAVLGILGDPLSTLKLLVSEEAKVDTLLLLGWPTLMVCLLSPLSLIALPHVLVRLLSDRPQWWQADFHYSAFTVVILFCAGVDGLARLLRRVRSSHGAGDLEAGASARDHETHDHETHDHETRGDGARVHGHASLKLAWAAAACAVALTLVPKFQLDQFYHPAFYDEPKAAAAAAAVSQVPSGVTVEAVNSTGPALTSRTTVLLWTAKSHGAPWVVADTSRWEFPFASADDQRAAVDRLLAGGYTQVFERDGYVVLRRN